MSSNWMPYLSHVGNQPATIVVDLGVEEADISRLPYLVRVRVAVRESGDTGFPSHEDSDEVNALDDSLNAALTSDERYVGRVTTHDAYFLHIYTCRPEQCEAVVREVAGGFKGRSVETRVVNDEGWSVYFKQLYPGRVELQAFQDDAVLRTLQEHGDSLSKLRPVDHWFYLPNTAARAKLAERLCKSGFSVLSQPDSDSPSTPFGLHVVREESVQPERIKPVTAWLLQLAEEHGGEYDGWETSIEK